MTKSIMYGSFLFIVFLAYLVPVDVLQKYPQFVPFVEFMAGWNFQIQRVGEISGSRSQVNMFIYSMTWCLIWIPIGIFFWYMFLGWSGGGRQLRTDLSPSKLLLLSAFGIFSSWFAYTLYGQTWPIKAKIGHMIMLSPVTSPAWSVGLVCIVVWFSLLSAVLFVAAVITIQSRYKG